MDIIFATIIMRGVDNNPPGVLRKNTRAKCRCRKVVRKPLYGVLTQIKPYVYRTFGVKQVTKSIWGVFLEEPF